MKEYIKKLIQEELANKLKETTHPWYTSLNGYYKGDTKAGSGPRHTGNVIDYLKPGTLVYNAKGESKRIKDTTSDHIMFTDGTKDYFMNWFPEKPAFASARPIAPVSALGRAKFALTPLSEIVSSARRA